MAKKIYDAVLRTPIGKHEDLKASNREAYDEMLKKHYEEEMD
jgi:hypothetical protein